jgi:flavin reductase (DIM6/NTAB) family NADH-FMN oxidoreductase RutF
MGIKLDKGTHKMNIDFKNIDQTDIYKLMSHSIIPRPIAWIVTEHDGIVNIAPFSYFTGLSSNPPTMIVSIGHKADGSQKDTLKNIRENGVCTICIASPDELDKLHLSSKSLDFNESEAEIYEIKTQKVYDNFPPMIEDIQTAYFCTLYQEVELKGSKTIPLIVEIKHMYISDKIVSNAEKFHFQVDPIARVGKSYNIIGDELEPPTIL